MINIKGWSRNDVSTFANMVGLGVNYDGYGYVKTYSIKEGTLLDKTSKLEVTLEPNNYDKIKEVYRLHKEQANRLFDLTSE